MKSMPVQSLRWRLVAVMCLAYIVVSIATLAAGYSRQQGNLHRALRAQAQNDAQLLAAGAATPLSTNNGNALRAFLARLQVSLGNKAQGLKSAVVIGTNGRVVASTNPGMLNRRVHVSADQFDSGRTWILPNGDVRSSAPIITIIPLGSAEVVLSGAAVKTDLQQSLVTEALLRGLGLLIFVLLSLVIAQFILGPLGRLARAARAIRRGEFSTRVPVDGGAELATLAEAFNDMAASLEQRIAHLSFLAISGATLPNTFRSRSDVHPILREFCEHLDAEGVCLISREDPDERSICYSQGDASWIESVRPTAERATQPMVFQEGPYALMVVPVLGDAYMLTARSGRPFGQEERQVITNFAYQIGIAADNARLLESQQEALQVKDHFLSIVSHELRTPLTTIKGYAQMLRRKIEGDEQSQRFADNIDAQVTRLSRLVDDLLDVTRFDRAQFELVPEEMDIQPVLEEVVARFRLVTPRHRLQLYVDGGPHCGMWDHDRLEQVMNNLVGNAIKYSPDGGTVTVSVRREDSHVVVSVRDQGMGISEEEQHHLFQRFYRAGSDREIKGLGLGLYVTRRIVEAHGGSIEVESRPGHGSEFRFTLPLQEQPAERPQVAASS